MACAGLKPRYNSDLIPTPNLIHIWQENETWCPATFLMDNAGTQVDLVQHFLKVSSADVLANAKEHMGSSTRSN
jgi:hypothetical protein